jgi:hypothetical protein
MKLLFGVVAYLVAVAVIAVAVSAGVLSVMEHRTMEQPVLASGTDGRGTGWDHQSEERRDDPNRVPVWIVPTAKYQYTPVPVEPPKQRDIVVGDDARGAKAKARNMLPAGQTDDARAAPRATYSSRDNDPFFRD